MSVIWNYLLRMVPAVILGLLVYLVSRRARLKRLDRRSYGTCFGHETCMVLMLMLTAGLLWLTVLPEIFWEDGHLILRGAGRGQINLRPFLILRQFWRSWSYQYFVINFWGNIVLFLPIGLFPTLMWRRTRWWKVLLGGFGLSLAIELCQIPLGRGTDIDDLWLNTLGAILGWLLARLIGWLAPRFVEGCKVRRLERGV